MKLRFKFLIPLVTIAAAMCAATSCSIALYLKENNLDRIERVTAEYVSAKAQQRLTPERFQDADFLRQRPVFESFMNDIKTPEIIKIKVFNAHFVIIYSTSDQDIGSKSDSANLKKAVLERSVVSAIKPPILEKSNIDMLGYRQVMEVYVPVMMNNALAGVIEAYFKMDAVNEAIRATTVKAAVVVALFALALVIVVYVMLTVMVVTPLRAITRAASGIAEGKQDASLPYTAARDEIGALTASLTSLLVKAGFIKDQIKDIKKNHL